MIASSESARRKLPFILGRTSSLRHGFLRQAPRPRRGGQDKQELLPYGFEHPDGPEERSHCRLTRTSSRAALYGERSCSASPYLTNRRAKGYR